MIKLSEAQTSEFLEFVKKLHSINWGLWADASTFPDFGTPYTAFQAQGNGGHLTIIKFDDLVRPFGYRTASRKWAAGSGGRRMKDTAGLGF